MIPSDSSLLDSQGQEVEAEQDVTCYLQEVFILEFCTYLLEPLQELSPNTDYQIRVRGTEYHQVPGSDW